ncbi:MAG TPA: tRNA pseudouridine(38-40) synthase TruA [Methanomassiliicoccales archaeon]|nr:tRNA pseudouridine(38-40) synthase TruA [Methanomassiliicoccales archaeon]
MTWRAAIKLAYDGRDFFGSQRQSDLPTVEDEVIHCLRKIKAIGDPTSARFRAASRTDRGVSALGNVVAFDTNFRQGSIIKALNSASKKVYFVGVAEVPLAFSPRRASSRWYRYFLGAEGMDLGRLEECAGELQGEHDFRRFCKADGRGTVKELRRVSVLPLGDLVVVDFEAREFLRNMVRRLVAAMAEVGSGRAELEDVRRAMAGEDVQFGLAPPEDLFLMDVRYDFEFRVEKPPNLEDRLRDGRRSAFMRLAFFEELRSEK